MRCRRTKDRGEFRRPRGTGNTPPLYLWSALFPDGRSHRHALDRDPPRSSKGQNGWLMLRSLTDSGDAVAKKRKVKRIVTVTALLIWGTHRERARERGRSNVTQKRSWVCWNLLAPPFRRGFFAF
jgi:hypothetical protein